MTALPISPSILYNIFDKTEAWIADHPEAVKDFVTTAYRVVLGRDPDPAGLQYWIAHVQNGVDSPFNLLRSFTNSQEFQSHFSTASDAVTSLYHTLLGREPDAPGLSYWLTKLTTPSAPVASLEAPSATPNTFALTASTTYDLTQITTNFLRSDEFVKHEGITNNALSLMGGGYKALYGDAAMVAGLLAFQNGQGQQPNLKSLFSDLEVISANSGSTWFVDLLAYSNQFNASLQDYKNFLSAEGYGGKLNQSFDQYFSITPKKIFSAVQEVFGAAGKLIGADFTQKIGFQDSILSWNDFVTKTVFQPYNDVATLKAANFADSLKSDAISDTSLVYIGGISSDGAAINQYNENGTNVTLSFIDNAGKESDGSLYNFIPALFSSPASHADKAATALPTIPSGNLVVSYQTNSGLLTSDAAPKTLTLSHVNFDGLSAFLASSVSSAAVGAADSKGFLEGGWLKPLSLLPNETINLTLHYLQDQAPLGEAIASNGSVTISDPAPDFLKATSAPADFSQSGAPLRLVDGGYIDNPSVTAALSYLQNNERLDGFVITLFNYLMPGDSGDAALNSLNSAYAHIGNAVSQLFTGASQQTGLSFGGKLDLSHPSAAVFDAAATTGLDKPIWSFSGDNNFNLSLYQLGVKTAADNAWGIQGGEAGTFNVWTITSPADALPQLVALPYSSYNDLYTNIVGALQTTNNGVVGASLLEHTLGII